SDDVQAGQGLFVQGQLLHLLDLLLHAVLLCCYALERGWIVGKDFKDSKDETRASPPDLPQRPPDLRLVGIDLERAMEAAGGPVAIADAELGEPHGGEGQGVARIGARRALEVV